MNYKPQVRQDHYCFNRYVTLERWNSFWRQAELCFRFQPKSVLEVGGGNGILKKLLQDNAIEVTSVDIAKDLKPDVVASVLDLPFADQSVDIACAFQVLEHLPYEQFIPAVKELHRVARKAVLISLPDVSAVYPFKVSLPGLGIFDFTIPRPYFKKSYSFDGQHYWELNKKETPLRRILKDLEGCGLKVNVMQRYAENIYHRFFVISNS